MPKRSVYLQPPDNPCRRTRRDIEFLCNYWDRLLALNRSHDIRLPELLRANHLIRHLSPLPTNHGLRVDVSFTVFDESDFSRPNNVHAETYQLDNAPPYYAELRNSGSCRLSRNGNAARCNNLLRDYARRASENCATATERELIRAGVLASLIDRGRIAGCQSALYNQRQAAASNYRFPAGSRASAMRLLSGQHDRYVNPRRMNNCHACASFRQKCCAVDSASENVKPAPRSTSQQPLLRQEKDLSEKLNHSPNTANQRYCQYSLPTSFSGATLGNLQTNDKTPKNRDIVPLERNDDAMKRGPKEPTETRRDGTVGAMTKTAHTGSYVKPVAVNNEGGSMDPWLSDRPQRGRVSPESMIVADRDRRADDKRRPDDMEDRATAVDLDRVSQDPTWANVKSRGKNTSKAIPSDESATRTAKSKIRNGRSSEMKLSSRRHSSSPKYASFLRMFRKKEVPDQRFRDNPSSFGENESNEKSQRRDGPSTESTANDNRAIREDPRIERRVPTPRSTVHTTYNPIMHSSACDPILDSSGITIQLLRLAALMYAPALMPGLNSLIAQQNHQTSVSLPSSEGGSSDMWSQVLRLLNEQQATANVSLISAGSERDSSVSRANTDTAENSPVPSEEQKDTSIAVKKPSTSQRESPSSRRSEWKSDGCRARQGGKERKWRLASMLDSGVRLDGSIFATEDFWKLEEFSKTGRRPENAQSLSTRSKNEIVVKEDLRDWMRRLLRQLDARGAGGNSSSNDEEAKGHPEGSSRTTNVGTDEFSWRGIKRRSAGRSVADESLNSSRDNSNVFTEHEEEDSDDQKSFASVASTNSSKSLRLKQDDARKNENENLKD